MENASKALIVAGAILIAILLISSAMLIINSINSPLNSTQSTMSELEKNSFNSQFLLYEGPKKSGSQVIELLKKVNTSNSSHDNKIAIKLSGPGFVMDSSSYLVREDQSDAIVKCNSSNVVSLDEIMSNVNKYRTNNYNIILYYCNKNSQVLFNNKHLNPIVGCVLLIHISRI